MQAKRTNTILQCYTESPEPHKPLKTQVPTYMSAQQWLIVTHMQNRPRGIAKALFSSYSKGQLSFKAEEDTGVRPGKKYMQPYKSVVVEARGIRVKQRNDKNPISQGKPYSDDPSFKPKPVCTRNMQTFTSQIQLDNRYDSPDTTATTEQL
jgi:hypothetical protein